MIGPCWLIRLAYLQTFLFLGVERGREEGKKYCPIMIWKFLVWYISTLCPFAGLSLKIQTLIELKRRSSWKLEENIDLCCHYTLLRTSPYGHRSFFLKCRPSTTSKLCFWFYTVFSLIKEWDPCRCWDFWTVETSFYISSILIIFFYVQYWKSWMNCFLEI